jgi:hypothetical protein
MESRQVSAPMVSIAGHRRCFGTKESPVNRVAVVGRSVSEMIGRIDGCSVTVPGRHVTAATTRHQSVRGFRGSS